MSGKIYVLIDHGQGKIRGGSWEALAFGQQMASETGKTLHAVILGRDAALAGQIASKRVDSVIAAQHDRLAEYDPDAFSAALQQILMADIPDLLLMAHIYQNIDLAPKLAAALGRGLVTDCIGYRLNDGQLVFVRQMFRSKLNADIRVRSEPPWIVTLQAGAISSDELEEGSGTIEGRSVDLSSVPQRRVQLEAIQAMKGKVDLNKAEVIVGVGRGIKKAENLKIIEDLAQALNAEIGASRPVVDNDWMERERQIGSSGQTVSPKLYIGCGISGAIQHVVGMKSANCIVAINTDANAPIFNIATYGIVGDLFEIVPALTKKLREEA
ncbi:MAG: electron transfer flavoprotein subunit alpha/FixB family protein [Acidobacteriota bacterium]